jgi:two-component system, NarL family, sensor histidine kinase DesK
MRTLETPATRLVTAGDGRTVKYVALAWLIWLPLMLPMIASLLAAHPGPLHATLSLLGLAVFVVLYMRTAWRNARKVTGLTLLPAQSGFALWLPILVLLALSFALTETNGVTWGGLFIFTGAVAAGRLPVRQAAALLVTIALSTFLYGWRTGLPLTTSVSNVLFIGLASVTTMAMMWAMKISRELRAEREDLVRVAAVAEERLRIARDLHDLLGHSLSLVVLKSELAGRLVHVAPERAASEIGDVETVARKALEEVREAIAGYRQPSLAREVAGAREMLAAAGIELRYEGVEPPAGGLPQPTEAILGWAVREGVTNVIRHSRARHCSISLSRTPTDMYVEVSDDGHANPSSASVAMTSAKDSGGAGNGLHGLAERVTAASGKFEAGPRPGGGFRLAVSIPIVSTPRAGRDADVPVESLSAHAADGHRTARRRVSPPPLGRAAAWHVRGDAGAEEVD